MSNSTVKSRQVSSSHSSSALWSHEFPRQIKFIVGNEAAERFSFYGMRSILVVFMTQYLFMAKEDAMSIFHLFVSACYLAPLLGGYLSDRYLGKYRTIMLFSSIYCLGHGTLALWENKMGLFFGLALISLAAGGIKPCVSAHVGDQFTEKNKHLIKVVFNLFYWSVNFGSTTSTLLIPVLLKKYGSQVAFGIPGVLMLLASVIFWAGRNLYVHVPPAGGKASPSLLHFLFEGVAVLWRGPQSLSKDGSIVWGVLKVFVFVSAFWALFDQHSSSWVLQAKQMNLNWMGMPLEASQLAALNPIMVLILIPVFSRYVYPWFQSRGLLLTQLSRIGAGMFLASSSFVFIGILQMLIDTGMELSVMWQFFPYLFMTASEVMVSITGLEFAYTQAPVSLKSTIMSLWNLTIFMGNLLTAFVSKINYFQGAHYFFFFAVVMIVFSTVFAYAAKGYSGKDQLVGS